MLFKRITVFQMHAKVAEINALLFVFCFVFNNTFRVIYLDIIHINSVVNMMQFHSKQSNNYSGLTFEI